MQNKKNMTNINMFICALIIFLFTFLNELSAFHKTDIPCESDDDCPVSIGIKRFTWVCHKGFCAKYFL
ncbi:unnamed protein product [Trifolium pratense]|uniref:Uncharacterized protein n=1 Tax=Trifolium pratense TaxID=57577 RepID=A0ACB0MBC4_TRIPR|nr:unnamed protein product [Trifolium pratense]